MHHSFMKRLVAPLAVRGAFFILAAAAATGVQAQAAGAESPSVYVQGGWAEHQTDSATIGITLPWTSWRSELWGSEVRGYWDIYASRWSYDSVDGGSGHTTLAGITPTFRLRPGNGRSPWFLEGGVGITYMDKRYHTPHKEFSTRYNFATHLGLGYSLGAQHQHEVAIRVQHLSNAGIKSPNPGENFVQLRYAYHF
ncbi:acyloxyacyl hydrolase [Paracidovorax cattleyae]|uniref:Lipid A deacylase n=1 Tax=Paracidovorax cattleyae TaxID=80868 RepID=A0A1H0TJ08_9BURK|nr:acyloxyacyl hydrolase [Paracidovorax cattleyae]AVS72674.1 acyloxyacyl hydrolase [Paracidovorax cattleyae]MBF9266391.1 acyloxyacyl hydrolase [Paracidovorax cattleyae]SDP53821.1 Lipid A 3-O-deacylase (PagL) [Paracidovorax cattleyae]